MADKKEKKYIERLLDDEKYFNELRKMYDEMMEVRKFKRKLDDIDKELAWFLTDEKKMFVPDYMQFYNHAHEHYLPKVDNTIVQSRYKELLGDYNSNDIPGFIYCLALLAHLSELEKEYAEAHEDTDEKTMTLEEVRGFQEIHGKWKLLVGFLEKIEPLVAVYINSIDMQDIEHLDDNIKELDSRAIKHRFMRAIRERDKSMTFKLLGRMSELDEGEDYYFEALSHFVNEEYEEAIRYIDKVGKKDIDYVSAVALKLECYSLLGDLPAFLACIKDNIKLQFEYWHINYLILSLILRLDPSKDQLDMDNADVLGKMNFVEQESSFYDGMVRRLVCNIVTEGLEILGTLNRFADLVDDFEIPEENEARLIQLDMALQFYPENFRKYINPELFEGKSYEEVKDEAEMALLKLLIDYNPDHSFENLRTALMMQLKLGDSKAFVKNINNNFDALKSYKAAGEASVDELISTAYVESVILGQDIKKLKKYIENEVKIDLEQDVSEKKILNFLSQQGRIAYEAAEWQFQKSSEEEYGWKDAGLISLGYYRIIEVELNKKVIIPLLSGIGANNLNNEFQTRLNSLAGDDKKDYRIKWGTILRTYQGMEDNNFAGNGFMLGVLSHFFAALGSEYDVDDNLAAFIKNHLPDVLTSYGESKFDEGFFEDITNDDTRNKFRNPPAHTKYLQYKVACECRDVFRKTILMMIDMMK